VLFFVDIHLGDLLGFGADVTRSIRGHLTCFLARIISIVLVNRDTCVVNGELLVLYTFPHVTCILLLVPRDPLTCAQDARLQVSW
jgi:hypothetical protein